jgi:hypothetical protein
MFFTIFSHFKQIRLGSRYAARDVGLWTSSSALNEVSSIQSNPIQSNPIQSNPIQSNPIQFNSIQFRSVRWMEVALRNRFCTSWKEDVFYQRVDQKLYSGTSGCIATIEPDCQTVNGSLE